MEITTRTKFRKVLKLEAFSDFKDYLNCFQGTLGWWVSLFPMKRFGRMWNAQSICDGFNRLKELAEQGTRVFYPVYEEEEAKHHPELREQVLFHFPVKEKTKFVAICAGGGYGAVCSMVEAFPAARRLNELGFHAFVVNYRAGKYAAAPNPQDDLAKAVEYIMKNAKELNVETRDYAVAGFSAGGHLAACFGTEALGYKHYGLPRPDALFLAYPVITMGEYGHEGSRINLLGRKNVQNKELIYRYSVEKQVSADYPSCFVWQCEEDREVPVENTQLLVKALDKQNIPYIYRTYPGDAHGLGLGEGTPAEGWLFQAVKFWEGQR